MTPEELRTFEAEMVALFKQGKIKAPLHLAGGNEDQLIDIFRGIKKRDWVLCSWRSHYHCLLKGVPKREVREAIIRGRSIALCFPQYRILSSAIVGGIAPIAVGIAWSIKQRMGGEVVHVFIGDMTARTGIVREAIDYATGFDLPVRWIVEDNGLSVCTDTKAVWGSTDTAGPDAVQYDYKLTWPHVGVGEWVAF